jgi:hypothetical protein
MTDLFSYVPKYRAFDGQTYKPARDYERLHGQLKSVYDLMADGRWRTLSDISSAVEGSEASLSARLRDLRKEKYGAHEVQRESVGDGLFRYRLVVG